MSDERDPAPLPDPQGANPAAVPRKINPEDDPRLPEWQRELWRQARRIPKGTR